MADDGAGEVPDAFVGSEEASKAKAASEFLEATMGGRRPCPVLLDPRVLEPWTRSASSTAAPTAHRPSPIAHGRRRWIGQVGLVRLLWDELKMQRVFLLLGISACSLVLDDRTIFRIGLIAMCRSEYLVMSEISQNLLVLEAILF